MKQGLGKLPSFTERDLPILNDLLRQVNDESGKVVQVVYSQDGAYATGTTALPNDDTKPQIGEGDEYMSLSIAPTSAGNYLHIQVQGVFSADGATALVMGLFQDSTANAIAVCVVNLVAASQTEVLSISYHMAAGITTSTTFSVRAGMPVPGNVYFNGAGGAGLMNGTMSSSITITEYIQ